VREGTDYLNIVAASEFAYTGGLEYRFGGMAGKTALGAELLGGVGLVKQAREELPLEAFLYVKHDVSDEVGLVGGVGAGLIAGYGVPVARGFVGLFYRPTSHDGDHDGVPDEEDRCPNEAEDHDRVQDRDGCPEEDGDSDGIPDEEDRCPSQKETINGFEDEDGCPDEGPAKVIVEKGRIQILETVKFKTGSAELEPESYSILNQVALTMKANRQIKRVRDYLVKRGVKSDRLTAQGFGPDRPLAKGTSADSLAKNRRVEFLVEQ
jgi:OmpA-OmpF porin, OOP family